MVKIQFIFNHNHIEQRVLHCVSCSVMCDSLWPHGLHPARSLCPWGFSRQEYWSRLPCSPPVDLPNSGFEPRSSTLQVDSLPSEPLGKPVEDKKYFVQSKNHPMDQMILSKADSVILFSELSTLTNQIHGIALNYWCNLQNSFSCFICIMLTFIKHVCIFDQELSFDNSKLIVAITNLLRWNWNIGWYKHKDLELLKTKFWNCNFALKSSRK